MFYTIENEYLIAVVSDLGATLVSLIDKKTNVDLILGYKTEEDYIKYKNLYAGATIGRCANVIKNAKFNLNNKSYKLSMNADNKHLHGGFNGLSFVRWNIKEIKENSISFKYLSIDGEEGYPGNLSIVLNYTLENNNLFYSYEGISDKDTLFNITNHTYFNFGKNNLENIYLRIKANEYVTKGDNVRLSVNNDLHDLREFKELSSLIKELKEGLDNDYLFENLNNKLLAELRNDEFQLNVYSNLPNVQVYTANSFDGFIGKNGHIYNKYCAIAIEPQFQPNSINYKDYLMPILKANNIQKYYIKYEITHI